MFDSRAYKEKQVKFVHGLKAPYFEKQHWGNFELRKQPTTPGYAMECRENMQAPCLDIF
jgi:hypothetical protein